MDPALKRFSQVITHFPHNKSGRAGVLRIGLLQLATDFTLEPDWQKLAGADVEIFSTRMEYDGEVTCSGLTALTKYMTQATSVLVPSLELDVLAFGCTSASMLIGEHRIRELMTANRRGLPVTNPWTAVKASLRHLGAKNIAVLTPYINEVNFPLYKELQSAGFEVQAFGKFGLQRDIDIPTISRASIIETVHELVANVKADAVFLSCTGLRVLDILEEMEAALGMPMVSSNQAMFWHATQLTGRTIRRHGYGRLLTG